jgi:hypothetical protein
MIISSKPSATPQASASGNPFENHPGYYASDIYEQLGFKSKDDFESTLADTFDIIFSSHISVKQNFKQVFRFNDGKMYTDWKISPLAYNFLKSNLTNQ